MLSLGHWATTDICPWDTTDVCAVLGTLGHTTGIMFRTHAKELQLAPPTCWQAQ